MNLAGLKRALISLLFAVSLAACVNQAERSQMIADKYRQASEYCAKQGMQVKYGKLTYEGQQLNDKAFESGGINATGVPQSDRADPVKAAQVSLQFQCVSTEIK